MDRRRFLQRTGKAGLAAGVASPLGMLAGCWGEEVAQPRGEYDAIIVGGGTAGAIVAAKLQAASGGRKRILIIEAGGPTLAAIGGTAYPAWLPPGRSDLTVFDVPGEYSQIPFTPFGTRYQLTETLFAFQGIGLGGNSAFNGMLFQTNPPAAFDRHWPAGWHWRDMAPHFDRVRARMPVDNTPSTDDVPYNVGPANIVHPLYAAAGWVEADTSRPFAVDDVYSRPYVVTDDGRRAGPITGYLAAVARGGVPQAGLEILQYAKAQLIELDGSGRATAVRYAKRAGVDQSDAGEPGVARLARDGCLIMAAGGLATPRLLLLSGIGPRGREAQIFPGQTRPPFAIDNQAVGVGLFDHVTTMIAYNYDGAVPYRSYNYGFYAGNAADLDVYLESGCGPYSQYQPVSILQRHYGADVPSVEVFLNPNGAGVQGGPYWGMRTLAAYVMLLDPKARAVIELDANGNVGAPPLYLADTPEGREDAALMAQAMFDLIALLAQDRSLKIVFGPGGRSHPNLRPDVLSDVRAYVTDDSPVDTVYFSKLVTNHFGGAVALSDGPGGVDPATLLLRGTANIAVVDASLQPTIVPGHPVGTVMAVADRAADILAARWG
jgi:choline dehydrogenase-like flavoprotein